MLRKSTLFLPLLLSLPLAVSAQTPTLSPALRAKLTAQNSAPAPGGIPAGEPAATAGKPAEAIPVPEDGPITDLTPAAVPAVPAAVPAPGTAPAPGAVPNVPRPTIPRPSIPLPGRSAQSGRSATPGAGTATPGNINPAALPAATTSGAEEESGNPWEHIEFLDAPVSEVIDKYEEITQRHVIRGPNVGTATVTLRANPNPIKKFTAEEAADFIKAALAIQGIIIQPYRSNIDKVLTLDKPVSIDGEATGFPLYTREEDLPEEDVVVNFVLTLKHLPAADAVGVLSQAVPVRQWTKYIAVPSANSIFIQEYTSNLRTLIKVTRSLDLPPIKMIHEWVELERASAEDVQAILDQILQAQSKGTGTGAGGSGFRSISPAAAAANLTVPGSVPPPAAAGAGSGASSGIMPDGSQVIVRADPRTNRVFVNGPEEHVKFLKQLIHEFDEPSNVKSLLTQQLRYIPVDDFFGVAVSSLEATGAGQAGTGSSGGGGGASSSARNTGGRSNSTSGDFGSQGTGGQNFRSGFNSANSSSSQFGGGGLGGSGGRSNSRAGGGGGLASSGGGGTLGTPQAQTVGKTLLISDPRTNSLIVSGPPDSIKRVSDLVKEMDRRPYQVHINAVIAQMSIGDDMSSSVDILRKAQTVNMFGETINTSGFFRSGASGSFIDPSALNSPVTFPALSGLNFYAAAEELFNAYVRLLETNNKSKLLAKPHITVANNEVGSISSGTRVPIPANQQSSVVGNNTTSINSSVEYENVVLSLDVQPLINSRNEITLNIQQLNDSIEGTTLISGNEIPNISTQQLQTKITIPNGAILILGGLIREEDSKGSTGIPVLSKIPVLKYLIGTNVRKKQRRELLVLLQARIIENADDMLDVNVSEIQRTVIGPDAELFASPDRNTDNVKLPAFENDIPFNRPADAPAPAVRRSGRSLK